MAQDDSFITNDWFKFTNYIFSHPISNYHNDKLTITISVHGNEFIVCYLSASQQLGRFELDFRCIDNLVRSTSLNSSNHIDGIYAGKSLEEALKVLGYILNSSIRLKEKIEKVLVRAPE